MTERSVEAIGSGDGYLVQSESNPLKVHLIFWSAERMAWLCSCPAPHARLRSEGRYCTPIAKVLTAGQEPTQPSTKPQRRLHPIQGGQQ